MTSTVRADSRTVDAASDAQEGWLFRRGNQSVYVKRLPMGMTLLVCGPGYDEHSHHFQSHESLNEFWRWYKRHLLAEEWVLTPDRRGRERTEGHAGPDRRRKPRELTSTG